MVYFPDTDTYDLIAEYKFPISLTDDTNAEIWPRSDQGYCGAVVQALRLDTLLHTDNDDDDNVNVDKRGIMEGGMGVKIVTVVSNGEASWWTVNRNDDDEYVGVDGIVL
jgi:hypothetical protein